jgi:hypothetical protein
LTVRELGLLFFTKRRIDFQPSGHLLAGGLAKGLDQMVPMALADKFSLVGIRDLKHERDRTLLLLKIYCSYVIEPVFDGARGEMLSQTLQSPDPNVMSMGVHNGTGRELREERTETFGRRLGVRTGT